MSGENSPAYVLGDDVPSDDDLRQADTEGVTEQASAPQAEPEPQPEPAPEPETEDDDPPETGKRVPLGELMRERERRKQAEARAEARERALEEGNKRLEQLLARLAPPAAPEPQRPAFPDIQADPVGHFQGRIETTEERVARLESERQAEQQQREFVNRYRSAAAEFASQAPDFQQAYAHAIAELRNDAAVFGLPAEQIEAQIVNSAFASGRNPAQALYEFAKRRGYGAQPAPQRAEQRIDAIERGQHAARSVSNLPGKPPGNRMSLEALANMPEEEFSRLLRDDAQARNVNKLLRQAG